jgi:hypothetical protein
MAALSKAKPFVLPGLCLLGIDPRTLAKAKRKGACALSLPGLKRFNHMQ